MKLIQSANSAASQKVRLVLHEKQLDFVVVEVDLLGGEQFSTDYLQLNPAAVVPTLVEDSRDNSGTPIDQADESILIESTLIAEYLDEAYDIRSLSPDSAYSRHQMRLICRQLDELHQACGDMTYATLASLIRQLVPQAKLDAQIERMPNALNRQHRRDVIENGRHSRFFIEGLAQHQQLFDKFNLLCGKTKWLAGDTFSLADCALVPYVQRIIHIGFGVEIELRHHLARWFDDVQQRPAFARTYDASTQAFIEILQQQANAAA